MHILLHWIFVQLAIKKINKVSCYVDILAAGFSLTAYICINFGKYLQLLVQRIKSSLVRKSYMDA